MIRTLLLLLCMAHTRCCGHEEEPMTIVELDMADSSHRLLAESQTPHPLRMEAAYLQNSAEADGVDKTIQLLF